MILAEMTLRSLTPGEDAGHDDFLARADILCALGFNVLISRFGPYYQLADYLAASTNGSIAIAVGMPTILEQLADEKYYTDLPGGVLEAAGRLFKRSVKMFVYPMRDPVTGQIQTLETAQPPPPWHHLGRLLVDTGKLVPIRSSNESYLSIRAPDVLAHIKRGDPEWETMVPKAVAKVIKTKNLFRG